MFFCVVAVLFFITNIAWSSEYHKHHDNEVNTTIIIEPAPVVINENTSLVIPSVRGVASAISAAQCHFDGGSFDLQLCGGYGNAFGQDAYTFGAGQKVGDFLLNFTETTENGKSSHGFGVNWKVKFK